ncbi:IS982 family transposase [Limibacter armeniacum]
MNENTVCIYCFVDDYLKATKLKEPRQRRMSDSQIITSALLACAHFGGNMVQSLEYLKAHHGFKPIDKSGFNRRLHGLFETILFIFSALGKTLMELNTSGDYLIDSFPVAVCRNIRIPRCRILRGEPYRGYNSSKREYFYGFKVMLITTSSGIPVQYFLMAGSVHDITGFQSMNLEIPEGSSLYGDAAFTDYDLEDLYAECENIRILADRKSNAKRKDEPWQAFIKKVLRKRVETTFSGITAKFPKHIHAVTPQGFIIKIFLFIFAYTIENVAW